MSALPPTNIHNATERSGIYIIQQGPDGPIKIGKASNIRRRLFTLQAMSGYPLTVLGILYGSTRREKALHARFGAHRLWSEWFRPTGEILGFAAANLPEHYRRRDVERAGGYASMGHGAGI